MGRSLEEVLLFADDRNWGKVREGGGRGRYVGEWGRGIVMIDECS